MFTVKVFTSVIDENLNVIEKYSSAHSCSSYQAEQSKSGYKLELFNSDLSEIDLPYPDLCEFLRAHKAGEKGFRKPVQSVYIENQSGKTIDSFNNRALGQYADAIDRQHGGEQ